MPDVMKRSKRTALIVVCSCVAVAAISWTDARPQPKEASGAAAAADNISGVVASSRGPEAGVWVIAETTDLPTKFRKIVVTDDQGRYLLPELPKANYKIWVRGYGLVDLSPCSPPLARH